jgi:sialate O-acetylesterase
MRILHSIVCAACLIVPVSASAAVKPHALFTDHMVLQQGRSVPVWGVADAGERVTVGFLNQQKSTTAGGDGKWMVRLDALEAGGPHTLSIAGKNTIRILDVLVGEVWIASGQSNMQWPVSRSADPEQTAASSENPRLRLFTVPRTKADAPTDSVDSKWERCGPETVPEFSAVAYFFGRDLQKARNVPVGVIHTSWGGSPAEAWLSPDALESCADGKDIVDLYAGMWKNYEQSLAQYKTEQAAAKAEGKEFKKQAPRKPWKPTELYNGMISSILPYAITGGIWYQGESNAGRAYQYRTLFPAMIQSWREAWGQGDFPFLLVQLAPFRKIRTEPGDSDWAELREAQLLSTHVLPNVGMAVITDVGEEDDIHPKQKEPVGARLALAARAIAYGEEIVYSGPEYKSLTIDGDEAVVGFNHVGGGLVIKGDALQGFELAGADRVFHNAKAEIRGETVVVTCPKVPAPVAVRYGWADYPVVNLWNADILPATPFRTDDFRMKTTPK